MRHEVAFEAEEVAPTTERALLAALADELVLLTAVLSDLAFDLGSDPVTLRRHLESLQAIDRITQTQLGIADMLRSTENVETRLAGITLEDMAVRLRERLG